mmetsp:Transcript_45943/g.109406  ORF Transcript_45943/g.109406 Transcript_45943/m.109406 type:complete len:616 (+) Transcript_45943:110-1957(+)
MSLVEAFTTALRARATDAKNPSKEAERLVMFVDGHLAEVSEVLGRFKPSGRLREDVEPLPASAYNDFYKWTMLPVMRAVETARGAVHCTVSVNVRDSELRSRLLHSAKTGTELFKHVSEEVYNMAARRFDRDRFVHVAKMRNVPGWDNDVVDSVCGPPDKPRCLAEEVAIDIGCRQPKMPSAMNKVLVQIYVGYDNRLREERVFFEATGAWHLVTWLETPLMQAVYDALLREEMRHRSWPLGVASETAADDSGWYSLRMQTCWTRSSCPGVGGSDKEAASSSRRVYSDDVWYPQWLADAMIRCVKSTDAAIKAKLKTVLMTGRRTGGMPLILLQELYHVHELKDDAGNSLNLGTSSVLAHYWLNDANVPLKIGPSGTHAHELQMVLGALLAEVDDELGCPLSSALSHALYFYLSLPLGDTKEPGRKVLMPFLPDTLGTTSFLKTAAQLVVPRGKQKGEPLLDSFGTARHDSGDMANFQKLCKELGFKGGCMASEIGTADDLMKASKLGFVAMGAGGFFGDSENAWDSSVRNISMAAKMLRVYEGPELRRTSSHPMKTGDSSSGGAGKFEADGLLSAAEVAELQRRAAALAACEIKVKPAELQARFEELVDKFLPQ